MKKPTLTENPTLPVPRCAVSGRIYDRGCRCPSCSERKKFHEENRRIRRERVLEYRKMMAKP